MTKLAVLACFLVLSACSRHVRLVTPDTTAGARYTCSAESQPCQPAREDDPIEDNRSGTTFVALPRECGGHIHQILIRNAHSAAPEVVVTCAPTELPIDEMR